ncbi:hypothetical protein QBC34DRAFT_36338 [Podospora aff. communis PSN243]|uniref:DUF1279 domain-containing protein n=1 Tax=Podospora aff. communis PSN243 TaxID=3040156 RepID=A0AAV9GVZ8_9PEZI|nr:hypothetical protein QBC34DRAFT_36338 [Podospora aff. communis PSN243]
MPVRAPTTLSPLRKSFLASAKPTTPLNLLSKPKPRRLTTKTPITSRLTSLLWSQRCTTIKELSTKRIGPFRASLFPVKRPFHTTRARRAAAEPTTLGARLKKLSREYGWAAVGIYMTLSVLDFPFCFLLVRSVGTERIAEIEHIVVSNVQKVIPQNVQDKWHEFRHGKKEASHEESALPEGKEAVGWGVKEADARTAQEGASLATQLALAYAIHKSFIFVRVPLTAAILPKVVKVLRGWGWEIGKRRARH